MEVSLFLTSAQSQFQMYYFHFTVDYCWAHQIVHLKESDRPQLMMVSSKHKVMYSISTIPH